MKQTQMDPRSSSDHLHQLIWKDADFQRKVELVWVSSPPSISTLKQELAPNSISLDALAMPTVSAHLRNVRRSVRVILLTEKIQKVLQLLQREDKMGL